ncbi:hypothetical protein EW145_g2123 [Phellinidium pouzarii]|uniref:Uncharacterized protein n=1 Tax=Phellinidium pouzarii TaxID=167371 RepID=A0A4S4LCB2_9AGAM|nr:hypothetical protein EW145_g2123 [Phellinidium pouzarii]
MPTAGPLPAHLSVPGNSEGSYDPRTFYQQPTPGYPQEFQFQAPLATPEASSDTKSFGQQQECIPAKCEVLEEDNDKELALVDVDAAEGEEEEEDKSSEEELVEELRTKAMGLKKGILQERPADQREIKSYTEDRNEEDKKDKGKHNSHLHVLLVKQPLPPPSSPRSKAATAAPSKAAAATHRASCATCTRTTPTRTSAPSATRPSRSLTASTGTISAHRASTPPMRCASKSGAIKSASTFYYLGLMEDYVMPDEHFEMIAGRRRERKDTKPGKSLRKKKPILLSLPSDVLVN